MRSANELLTNVLSILDNRSEEKKECHHCFDIYGELAKEIRYFLSPEGQEIVMLGQFISNSADHELIYKVIKAADPNQDIYEIELPEECEDDRIMIYEPFEDSILTVQDLLDHI